MRIGAHLSIAGGVHHCLELAHGYGFAAVACFIRNQRQWKAAPLAEAEVEHFRRLRKQWDIWPVVAHGSYLLNLCSRTEIRDKSIVAVDEDLRRCERLGIEYLVIHPGSSPDVAEGLRLIADALDQVLADYKGGRARILIETTAGAGGIRAGRFEELAEILSQMRHADRVGVCMDTCHIFAAGYDIRTPETYEKTMAEFDRIVGLDKLAAVHANDSVKGLGSHADRHAHIGAGEIGRRGFANFVNDPRLADIARAMGGTGMRSTPPCCVGL